MDLRLALTLACSLAPAPALHELRVPPALAEVTSAPEPSGITFCPALDRYLVVSDDTGRREQGTSHQPMVLAMDATGALDEAPVPITGIERLNDPEAICAGPGRVVFLVTSHSPDRRGRTGHARRQLLMLEPRGRSLEVQGRLDLTAIDGGRSLLELAGLDPQGRLDVEGLAWRDGALFVGLKSPLTTGGGAVVLRLAAPEAAFRRGRIAAGDLTRWAELPLCVGGPGGRVCQGIADLLFVDDGTLLVAANAPKGGPADGGGAVWRVRPPAPPALLARFPGLKPEGLALSPGRDRVRVVFDRGQERRPLWTELPLPR